MQGESAENKNIKNSIYVLAGGSIASISTARALSYVQEETGIETAKSARYGAHISKS